MISKVAFGTYNGEIVYGFILENEKIKVQIIEYGATITKIYMKEENRDVVLGYDDLEGYIKDTCFFGSTVGRCANRIEAANYIQGRKIVQLEKNDGENHLHGGTFGLHKKLWKGKVEGKSVILRITCKESEDKYPGTIEIKITVELIGEQLIFHYYAESDEDTLINLTNHSYFNLNGHNSGNIFTHYLKLNAKLFMPCREDLIPDNRICFTKDTPFDFEELCQLEKPNDKNNEQIRICKGYDHNYIVDKSNNSLGILAEIWSEDKKVCLKIYSDAPCFQLYTGNSINNVLGKEKSIYKSYQGICIEPQLAPNAINSPWMSSPLIKKREKYQRIIKYQFNGGE
ncbi:aldose epimerase family protein [Clostridium algidicarnis]|uniref:aldose epimerase family protein n=1 Tax=Clostridium algidicarnis TaxID=37659 RepID=UPI00068A634E|nr:aldose epimerase family protein [Clostridium algidicarnis]